MPTLERKIIDGNPYYYAVWKKRINGKVRKVKQVYLGNVERMAQAALGGGLKRILDQDVELASRPFGGAALMLHINELSGFIEICDRRLGAERVDSSPGAYLFLTIANRLLHPTSKNGIEEWYRKRSSLYWLDDDHLRGVTVKRDGERLSPSGQNIWNYMEMLTDDAMERIWNDVTARIRERLSIRDMTFFFDTTNFFDYIDEGTNEEKRNLLPRKGYSKQHRSDKNQVSLGLFMGGESMMPYSHATYAGNIKDHTHFRDVVEDLKGFMKRFGRENVILVIDKGCATEENISRIRDYAFISTMQLDEAPRELLAMKLEECYVNERGRTVYSSSGIYDVKGVRAKVVCTFSESLRRRKERALARELGKAEELLSSKDGHTFRDEKAAFRFAEKSLPRNFRRAIRYEVVKSLEGEGFTLRWGRDGEAIREMRRRKFGRNFIFTTRLDWSEEQIIRAYRSLYKVENQFKFLHGSMLVPITPVRHWTDQKIEAHIFLCMVGLLFARTIEYVARVKGIAVLGGCDDDGEGRRAPLSYGRIIEAAENVQLVMIMTSEKKKRIKLVLSNAGDEFNRSILDTFDLKRFAPRRQA